MLKVIYLRRLKDVITGFRNRHLNLRLFRRHSAQGRIQQCILTFSMLRHPTGMTSLDRLKLGVNHVVVNHVERADRKPNCIH
jgi:hypothetical protein